MAHTLYLRLLYIQTHSIPLLIQREVRELAKTAELVSDRTRIRGTQATSRVSGLNHYVEPPPKATED